MALRWQTILPSPPPLIATMVSDHSNGGSNTRGDDAAVTGRMLSTVTTASVTGGAVHELSGADLAMRLHYLRILYCFRPGGAVGDGLATPALKEPMFPTLDCFSPAAGRIRKGGPAGRPHIKCNDSGARVVEARCERRMDEWLESRGPGWADGQFVPDSVLGPDLYFSPLLFIQFTRFKCGGLAVGVSWPHVLGDPVSASNCINLWGRLLAGKPALQKPHYSPNPKNLTVSPATGDRPLSLKQVETNGDLWLPHTKHRMVTSSFRITRTNLRHLQSKMSRDIPAFEAISALIWQSVARFRVGKTTNLVTKIRNDCSEARKDILTNRQIISTVVADSSPAKLEVSELAMLISEATKDEKQAIEETVDRENGTGDFIVYGANLTFVDMEGVDLYGFDLKGQRPACLEYNISGVGDEGAVLVLQEPDDARDGGGKTVTVILPEHEMPKLKEVLGREWGIA